MNLETRDDFLWLMSEEADPILKQVQGAFAERVNVVRIAKSLRKLTTPTRGALVMEQAQLRKKAGQKFTRASRMFFTRRGLEQASGQRLAEYKASRFQSLENVADVCCGIGGDLLSLARRGQSEGSKVPTAKTVGVEIDELTSLFARKNLDAYSLDQDLADVRQIDFAEFDLSKLNGIHVDPDRRVQERTVHGSRFLPSLPDVFQRLSSDCTAAIKVAPATPYAEYFPPNIQREWIGDDRECKQQILWVGPETVQPGHRTATHIGKQGEVSQISILESESRPGVIVGNQIMRYLYEPHAIVLAAQLNNVIGDRHGLQRFSADVVYLTGDEDVKDPLLTQFEVLAVLPINLR
ncbi:class I SAM-dependent methyltransferase, partial [bacterium]|nr:class I SAM-dependent methyltransferase [bacterium]